MKLMYRKCVNCEYVYFFPGISALNTLKFKSRKCSENRNILHIRFKQVINPRLQHEPLQLRLICPEFNLFAIGHLQKENFPGEEFWSVPPVTLSTFY